MSFFGKFKGGSGSSSTTNNVPEKKKTDPNAAQLTPLEKHLKDISGPIRTDGSDKFFGFENYGSTCYSNSIIQCLYYSAPFRSYVMNFPSQQYLSSITATDADGAPLSPRSTSTIPWPNPTSPARKQPPAPGSAAAAGKPEETKDSPEYRKRMALQAGPIMSMIHDNSNRYGMDESLFTALKDIFDGISKTDSRIGVVSPHKFLEILRRENISFGGAMHQDAHEFLNILLNTVVEEVDKFEKEHPANNEVQANGAPPEKSLEVSSTSTALVAPKTTIGAAGDTHWVHDLFEGLLTSETRCISCANMSQRDEPFLDLSVDLSAYSSVTSCLRKFSEEETLGERNKFHCDNCGGLQEAEKRMKIKRLPRVLALHLKRFKYTEDLQRLQKVFHRVVYPYHLRLFHPNTTDDCPDADRLYELYAVVVHIGGGPYHGHYVSIIKTQDQGWLLFDDELVEPVDKSYVLNFFGGEPIPGLQDAKQLACAYVLFYQETTLEAVLREQEMENQQPTEIRVSGDAPLTAEVPVSPTKNGVHATPIVTSPIAEDRDIGLEGMPDLAHAATAPAPPVTSSIAAPLEQTASAMPASPVKSKKERKAEEKEQKAAEKAKVKALEEKRRIASQKRVEAMRKEDEQVKAAIAESRQMATDDSKKRTDDAPKEGGLARFRTGSMSLRNKPKLFGSKDKDASTDKLAAVPQEFGNENLPAITNDVGSTTASSEKAAPEVSVKSPLPEEKSKKHRFSLGRKKSQALG